VIAFETLSFLSFFFRDTPGEVAIGEWVGVGIVVLVVRRWRWKVQVVEEEWEYMK